MHVNNRLKSLRHRKEMTQTQFAEFLGVSKYQYNRYELQKQQPTLEIALEMSDKLGVSVNDIFFLTTQANN